VSSSEERFKSGNHVLCSRKTASANRAWPPALPPSGSESDYAELQNCCRATELRKCTQRRSHHTLSHRHTPNSHCGLWIVLNCLLTFCSFRIVLCVV
jgi:hypothetical protein